MTRCHSGSANVSGLQDDSQSYAVCVRRTCGSHAHPIILTSPCGSHTHPRLSPKPRNSQECANHAHTPRVSQAHPGPFPAPADTHLGSGCDPTLTDSHAHNGNSTTSFGNQVQSGLAPPLCSNHAHTRLTTTYLSHAQVPPLVPENQTRNTHCSSHAHLGPVSTFFISPSNPGVFPASYDGHAHRPLIPTVGQGGKSLERARYSGPNSLGANFQQNKEPLTLARSPPVEVGSQELGVKSNETPKLLCSNVTAMASAASDGCPDLVQNNSLT